MNARRLLVTTAALAATATALALPATSAEAAGPSGPGGLSSGCVEKRQLAGPSYDVSLCGVVDVDQFRKGIALDGSLYCGPSALFDVLDWWATREDTKIGWFSTDLRNVDPADPADYMVTGNAIERIAEHAKFSEDDGGVTMDNLKVAFGKATQPVRDTGGTTKTGSVDSRDVDFATQLATRLASGPLTLVYGRYTPAPANQGLARTGGGHIVTVVGARGNDAGNTITLDLSDPGRAADHLQGSYLYTQSAYQKLTATLTRTQLNEFTPVADNPQTPFDESHGGLNGTYRTITRWVLTGPAYASTSTQVVEGFTWYAVDA